MAASCSWLPSRPAINDLYREAARLGIEISGCEVIATVRFEGVGLAASSITYVAKVESQASADRSSDCLRKRTGWRKSTTRFGPVARSSASRGVRP